MKYCIHIFLLILFSLPILGQEIPLHEKVHILLKKGDLQILESSNGELELRVSPKQVGKLKRKGTVSYMDFGAIGDGKTNDINAIAATHAFANAYKLKVVLRKAKEYYVGKTERTAIIQTNVDFGEAKFIIDDTDVINKNNAVFKVTSNLTPFELSDLKTLKRGQGKIDITLAQACLITVTNDKVKHYIRYGLNPNNGSPQTDIFKVDQNGNVDQNAPIIWDFNAITKASALPIDQKTLQITGGKFLTIANAEDSQYNYYSRNISISRSNVVVDGLEHRIQGEGDTGAPYRGFVSVSDCYNVTVKNTLLTGHKTYRTIGRAGKPVSMGSYDLSVSRAVNVSFINCSQTNDINDRTYWGILGSNYSKNMLYDGCKLSRFDAHKGVANATIRNSTLGYMGVKAIGSGTLTIENSTIKSYSLIGFRPDYGSTWQGNVIIKNVIYEPTSNPVNKAVLFGGRYTGKHDFGYTCYMPKSFKIENLTIKDGNHTVNYTGPVIFDNFNPDMKDKTYVMDYPNMITKRVDLKNIKIESGKTLRLSDNLVMFKDVIVINQ